MAYYVLKQLKKVFPNKNYCDKLVQKCLQLFSKENDTFSDLIQLDNFGDRKGKIAELWV